MRVVAVACAPVMRSVTVTSKVIPVFAVTLGAWKVAVAESNPVRTTGGPEFWAQAKPSALPSGLLWLALALSVTFEFCFTVWFCGVMITVGNAVAGQENSAGAG